MKEITYDKPPVGMYAGKIIKPIQIEEKTSKKGNQYEAGDVLIDVKGPRGTVTVDGPYALVGVTREVMDFFKGMKKDDKFVFTSVQRNDSQYRDLTNLMTIDQLQELMGLLDQE